jgi:beta-lactam-binding protein with PASTA domain
VPDVTGLTVREAVSRLWLHGIPVLVHGSGVVLRQEPAPGDTLRGRWRCTLEAG